ncbi:hypothetical protein ACIQGZ_20865 [Streptomyces sp. NPDC092296]|uniref:hypothetical protein n=1 Tax=Streptomyces sp. NPDC092296 TaxID=3366012 RepID=UPI0038210A38
MYQATAPLLTPSGTDTQHSAPLRLARVVHRAFGPGESRIDDEFSTRHFTDIAGAYGRDYRPDLAPGGTGNTFATMSRELVEALGPDAAEIQVAVVGHVTPDLDCRSAATTYLSDAWPAGPLAFGVSEQGCCTPLTALRLAQAYAARHGLERALVLLLDQATLPYETGRRLAGDAGIALLLNRTGTLAVPEPRVLPGVAAERVRDTLAEQLADIGPTTLLVGPGIDPDRDLPAGSAAHRSATGFPAVGLWADLAASAELPLRRPAALIDRDPDSGDLAICLLRPTPDSA